MRAIHSPWQARSSCGSLIPLQLMSVGEKPQKKCHSPPALQGREMATEIRALKKREALEVRLGSSAIPNIKKNKGIRPISRKATRPRLVLVMDYRPQQKSLTAVVLAEDTGIVSIAKGLVLPLLFLSST